MDGKRIPRANELSDLRMLSTNGNGTMTTNNYRVVNVLLIFSLLACSHGQTTNAWQIPREHYGYLGDIQTVVLKIARDYRVVIVAELPLSGLPDIALQPNKQSATEILEAITKRHSQFSFSIRGNVAFFSDRRLIHAKYNVLDQKLGSFHMPKTMYWLQVNLPPTLDSVARHETYANTGGPTSREFKEWELQPVELKNVSGRDVLIEAARQHPQFYVLISYKNVPPKKPQKFIPIASWMWEPFDKIKPSDK